jgi:hypothetical protein
MPAPMMATSGDGWDIVVWKFGEGVRGEDRVLEGGEEVERDFILHHIHFGHTGPRVRVRVSEI